MDDAVIDTTVVAFANSGLTAGRKKGNVLDRRVSAIERCTAGKLRVRYNGKLFAEYQDKVREFRNDFIEAFFAILDSAHAVRVNRSTLSRQDYERSKKCGWPSHDQHLLAAGVGGVNVSIFATEGKICACKASVRREFGFNVVDLSS